MHSPLPGIELEIPQPESIFFATNMCPCGSLWSIVPGKKIINIVFGIKDIKNTKI